MPPAAAVTIDSSSSRPLPPGTRRRPASLSTATGACPKRSSAPCQLPLQRLGPPRSLGRSLVAHTQRVRNARYARPRRTPIWSISRESPSPALPRGASGGTRKVFAPTPPTRAEPTPPGGGRADVRPRPLVAVPETPPASARRRNERPGAWRRPPPLPGAEGPEPEGSETTSPAEGPREQGVDTNSRAPTLSRSALSACTSRASSFAPTARAVGAETVTFGFVIGLSHSPERG